MRWERPRLYIATAWAIRPFLLVVRSTTALRSSRAIALRAFHSLATSEAYVAVLLPLVCREGNRRAVGLGQTRFAKGLASS